MSFATQAQITTTDLTHRQHTNTPTPPCVITEDIHCSIGRVWSGTAQLSVPSPDHWLGWYGSTLVLNVVYIPDSNCTDKSSYTDCVPQAHPSTTHLSATTLANPKSVSFMWPVLSSRMFSGLRSLEGRGGVGERGSRGQGVLGRGGAGDRGCRGEGEQGTGGVRERGSRGQGVGERGSRGQGVGERGSRGQGG